MSEPPPRPGARCRRRSKAPSLPNDAPPPSCPRRQRRGALLPPPSVDPALRQPTLLRSLDQIRQQPAAGRPRLAALLRTGDERLRCGPLAVLELHLDVDLLRQPGGHAFLAQHRIL